MTGLAFAAPGVMGWVPSSAVEFSILGPLVVTEASAEVEIRRGIPRALLTWLALRAPEPVSAELLIDRLWGDRVPGNPANALQIQISYLRKRLGRHVLATSGAGYALDADLDAIDANRFERLVDQAAREAAEGAASKAMETVGEAVALWRGEPLAEIAAHPDSFGDHTRLIERHLSAMELRVDLLLSLARHGDAIGELQPLIADNPLRERFHAQLMLALYRSGRQAEALRAYENARRLLVDELGLEPGAELRHLESRILAQDPSLDAPAGAGSVAPPRAAERVRTSLPAPITPLIARDAEVDHVVALLGRTRHLTLTGPGGAGKTRLAIEVAGRLDHDVETWFVDLSPVDASLVGASVASVVGAATTPDDDVATTIAAFLAEREGVLVLDTCEHVGDEVARLASEVLRSCRHVRVLATSRRPVGLTGELAWPVPPLSLPPFGASDPAEIAGYGAVALFCARAAAVRPDFSLTSENAPDVAGICVAVDGLPLAIELAAARADVLSPRAINARLQDRFALLVSDASDVVSRQRTLRAAIDWSVELLSADEVDFLAALSAFAGSFTLEGAAYVNDVDDGVALQHLRSLVRNSVSTVLPDDRFRLLDSLRVYAADLATLAGVSSVASRRHAELMRSIAERAERGFRSEAQPAALAEVKAELSNIRGALDWCFAEGDPKLGVELATAMSWFWTHEGMLAEAVDWLDAAVAADVDDPRLRARALLGASLQAAPLGDLERARLLAAEAAEIARVADMAGTLGVALVHLGTMHWALGDLDEAACVHDEAIARGRQARNPWCLHMALAMRTRTAIDTGQLGRAAELLAEVVPRVAAGDDRQLHGLALEQAARLALVEGRSADAARHATEALDMHEAIGYREGVVAALHLLGLTAYAAGEIDSAFRHHERALRAASQIGLSAGVIEALEALAHVAVTRGDDEHGRQLLAAATAERERIALPLRHVDEARVRALQQRLAPLPEVDAGRVIVGILSTPAASS